MFQCLNKMLTKPLPIDPCICMRLCTTNARGFYLPLSRLKSLLRIDFRQGTVSKGLDPWVWLWGPPPEELNGVNQWTSDVMSIWLISLSISSLPKVHMINIFYTWMLTEQMGLTGLTGVYTVCYCPHCSIYFQIYLHFGTFYWIRYVHS